MSDRLPGNIDIRLITQRAQVDPRNRHSRQRSVNDLAPGPLGISRESPEPVGGQVKRLMDGLLATAVIPPLASCHRHYCAFTQAFRAWSDYL